MRVRAEGWRQAGSSARVRYSRLEVAAVIAAGAGRYANSMAWKSGVEVREDCNSESQTQHRALRSWLLRKSTSKRVVEEAARKDLLRGETEKCGAFGDAREFRVRESRFMPQPGPPVENEVGFRQR